MYNAFFKFRKRGCVMEQKMEKGMVNLQTSILNNHEGYYPDWGDRPVIELFNPELEEGTYYLTKHFHQGYRVFYQVRNPQYENNQQLWVENIQFLITDDGIQVIEYAEYRLIDKGEHSFSWGTYQEQQSEFHLNITNQDESRLFSSINDFLASTPCKRAAPSHFKHKRINNDYDTKIIYHRVDYQEITASETNNHSLGRKKIILSEEDHNSLLDWMPPEIGCNISRRLDWFTIAQAQLVSKQWFNFFHDKSIAAPGYYPQWGDRALYELFNPSLKEGTFYFTGVDKEYRLYIQRRNQALGYNESIWVECQHFTLLKGTISVTQIDELRLLRFHDGFSYDFDSFKDDGWVPKEVGISSNKVKVDYNSLEIYLQQFIPENAAPKNLRLKRTANGYWLSEPQYFQISSVCEKYDQNCLSHK